MPSSRAHGPPGRFVVKKITTAGTFRFQQRVLDLANTLVDQQIGLEETDDGIWAIHFQHRIAGDV